MLFDQKNKRGCNDGLDWFLMSDEVLDDAAVEVTRDGRRAVPLLADDSALDRPSSSLSLSELVDAAFLRDVSFEGDEQPGAARPARVRRRSELRRSSSERTAVDICHRGELRSWLGASSLASPRT